MARAIHDNLTLLKPALLTQDVTAFLVAKQAQGVSPRYLEFLRDELRFFGEFLADAGLDTVQSITAQAIRQYLIALGERRNPGGVHCAFRAIKTFLRWYETEYQPEDWVNPIAKVKPPKLPQEALDAVPLADVKAMLATCDDTVVGRRDKAMLLVLLDTGLRASELCGLDLTDVNLSNGSVLVRSGKGGKAREVFLSAKTRRELNRYLRLRGDQAGPLFLTVQGGRFNRHGITSLLRRLAERAGVPAPGANDFRRAFAILSLRGGADLLTLQRLMGHSNLELLRRYAKQVEDDLAKVHAQSSPVANWL